MTQRKSRRKWKWKIGRIFKATNVPARNRWEEDVVMRALITCGGATARQLCANDPHRFRSPKSVALICQRLVAEGRARPDRRYFKSTRYTFIHTVAWLPVYGPERDPNPSPAKALKLVKRKRRRTHARPGS